MAAAGMGTPGISILHKGDTKFTRKRWDTAMTLLARGWFLLRIVREVRAGNEYLGIEADPDFPSDDTIREWAASDESLAREFARAREHGYMAKLELTDEIADDGTNDWMLGQRGGLVVNQEAIGRSRLRVETTFKQLACLDPRRFGPKLELAGNPDNPPYDKRDLKEYTEAQLLELFAEAQKRSGLAPRKKGGK